MSCPHCGKPKEVYPVAHRARLGVESFGLKPVGPAGSSFQSFEFPLNDGRVVVDALLAVHKRAQLDNRHIQAFVLGVHAFFDLWHHFRCVRANSIPVDVKTGPTVMLFLGHPVYLDLEAAPRRVDAFYGIEDSIALLHGSTETK